MGSPSPCGTLRRFGVIEPLKELAEAFTEHYATRTYGFNALHALRMLGVPEAPAWLEITPRDAELDAIAASCVYAAKTRDASRGRKYVE